MNAQFVVRFNTWHVLWREKCILTELLFLCFAKQQLCDIVTINLVGEYVVFVQKIKRIINASPQGQQKCNCRVWAFTTRQTFCIGYGIFDVFVTWNHGKLQSLIGMIDFEIARVVAEFKEALCIKALKVCENCIDINSYVKHALNTQRHVLLQLSHSFVAGNTSSVKLCDRFRHFSWIFCPQKSNLLYLLQSLVQRSY